MSKVIEAICERCSVPKLMAPAPTQEQLQQMLRCAVRAPDHGRLRPWRFVVLAGDALVALGNVFAETQPEADPIKTERLKAMPLRAPMIIVAIACVDHHHKKVPAWEQVVTVGIATQHIQLAAWELGYGAMWRTGEMVDESLVKQHLNLSENEQIVAFLYLGTPESMPSNPNNATLEGIVEYRMD